jgi:hypothetical protein
LLSHQSEEAAEGPAGSAAEGGGAHLLHQLPGCRGGQAAEGYAGKWTACSMETLFHINSAKERNVPFSGLCLSKIICKNPNNFTDLHCKGFKHCFPCLFNEP